MLYAILCYHDEDVVSAWTKEEDDAVLAKRAVVTRGLAAEGRLGPVARLMPTTAAVTVRSGSEPFVIDGPFAETKEQLLGGSVRPWDAGQSGRSRDPKQPRNSPETARRRENAIHGDRQGQQEQ
jgi:hypothetical protein